jgi:hypothetical protein
MNFKKMSAKALSVFLSLLMIFSICAPAAMAAADEHEHAAEKPNLNYVSLGDSMSNGFGLDGYGQRDHRAEDGKGYDVFADGEVGHYGDDAYTNQFADYLGGAYTVNHSKLAVSAMLSRDLLFLVGGGKYVEDGYCGFEDYLGVYCGNIDEEFLAKLQALYIEKITEADVITMGVGNAEIGAYIMHRLTDIIGFTGADYNVTVKPYIDFEALKERCDAELVEKVIALRDQLLAELPQIADFDEDQIKTVADLFAYTALDLCNNYTKILDTIVGMNPDVEIIVVGLMNTLNGLMFKVDENTTVDFGDYMGIVLDIVNTHISTYATVQVISNPAYENANIYYAESPKVEVIVDTFSDGLNDIVRDRFLETLTEMLGAFGMDFSALTVEDIKAFEADRIAYAMSNSPEKVVNITKYLAIEEAVIKASNGATMSLDTFAALSNLSSVKPLLDAIMGSATEGIEDAIAASKANKDDIYNTFIEKITAELKGMKNKNYLVKVSYYDILTKYVYNSIDEFYADVDTMTVAELRDKIATGIMDNYYRENFSSQELIANNFFAKQATTLAIAIYNTAASKLNDYYTNFYNLYYIPENVSEVMANDELLGGLLNFLGRCKIGNGIGTHPSANGHNDLFEAVRKSYVDGYRTVDKTVDDFRILCEYLYAHREEIYAQAYKQAEIAGIIAAINGSLDNAVAAVKYAEAWAFEYEEYFMGEDFALQINASVESTIATIEALRTLINEAKVLDEKIYDNAVALLAQLKANVAELATLVNIAAEDAYIYGTEVLLPAVDAEVAKIVEAAMAELKIAIATLNAQINTVLETVASVEAAVTETIAAVKAYVEAFLSNKAFSAKYTVSENSYILAIGEDNLYGEILTEMLGLGADQFGTLGWGELDAAEIAKADLITIGYNESLINRFAIEQFRGFVADYINVTLRDSAEAYVEAALAHFFGQLKPAPSAEVLADIIDAVKVAVNAKIDEILGIDEIFAGAELVDMDWDALVGSENASYVEGAVDAIVDTLISEEVIVESAAIPFDVVDLLYDNIASIDASIAEVIDLFDRAEIEEMFGEYANYNIELPIAEAVELAIESYFYNYIKFNAEYAQTVLTINAINPDATVVLLGNYNAFDGLGFDLTIGEIVIDLGKYITPEIKDAANAQLDAVLAELFNAVDNTVNVANVNVVFDAIDTIIAEVAAKIEAAQGEIPTLDLVAALAAIEVPDVDLIALVGEENLPLAKRLLAVLKFSLKEAAVYEDVLNAVADFASMIPTTEEIFAMVGKVNDAVNSAIGSAFDFADAAAVEAFKALDMSVAEARKLFVSLVDYVEIAKNEVLNAKDVLNSIYDAIANYDIVIDSQVIDLGEIFGNVTTGATVAQSIAAAFSIKNVIYVDIYDAETIFDSMGVADVELFLLAYLFDSTITNVSEAGHAYIAEQIFNSLYITCDHFDNDNDHACDICGEVISECADTNNDYKCDVCGKDLGHKCADTNKDHKCDVCGATLTQCADTNKDHKCDTCGKVLSECADTNKDHKCDTCGKVLSECSDANNDYKCDVCGKDLGHECVDANKDHNCDVCGTKLSECADADHDHNCDVCKAVLSECQFGEWVVTKEATKKEAGEQQRTCSICGAVESQMIAKLEGMSTGAVVAIVAASVVVAGGIGFAAYWFIFKKKIFAK